MVIKGFFIFVLLALLTLAGIQPGQAQGVSMTPAATQVVAASELSVSSAEVEKAVGLLAGRKVAIIACTLQNEYHRTLSSGIADVLATFSIQSEILDANASADTEVSLIDGLIGRSDIGALAVCNLFGVNVTQALERALKHFDNVVLFGDSLNAHTLSKQASVVSSSDLNGQIGFAAGEMAARWALAANALQPTVLIVDYPDLASIVVRATAMQAAIRRLLPKAHILGHIIGGTSELGEKNMTAWLKANKDLPDLIVSINDAGSLGVVTALTANGVDAKKVALFSIDGDSKALELLRNGQFFQGIVTIDVLGNAMRNARAMVKLLAGSDFPHLLSVALKPVDQAGARLLATAMPTMQPTLAVTTSAR